MDLSSDFIKNIEQNQLIIHKISNLYFDTYEDREDYFQDVVYNAWKSYPNFEGKSKFSTWLYKVSLNTALKKLRSRKTKPVLINVENYNNDLSAEENCYEEKVTFLYNAINKLDDLDKSITMLYLDKLSYKEISEITGLTETNVGVKINRIKQKLKIILDGF